MTDDATLSEFESRDETDTRDRDRHTALSTYAWGSYTCRRCEAETERVWYDDGVAVCPACKSW